VPNPNHTTAPRRPDGRRHRRGLRTLFWGRPARGLWGAVAGLLLLTRTVDAVAGEQERGYGGVLDEGWRVSAATGSLEVADAADPGTAHTLSVANGAHVINDRGRHWDFEVGLAFTRTASHPEDANGASVRANQTDVYYQARRLFGESPWFLGWHVALTRTSIQPTAGASDRDLGFTAGLVAGYRGPGRIGVQIDGLVTDPEPDGLSLGYETRQLRGGIVLRF